MLITEHFKLEEFKCKNGEAYPVEWIATRLKPLCLALEEIRKALGVPLQITSGYRSKAYNGDLREKAIARGRTPPAKFSQHMLGNAVDFVPVGLKKSGKEILKIIENLINKDIIPQGGLSSYPDGHIHYDQRGHLARW